jgi:HAD superfamily hydrolase (TIGR01484 family)
MALFDDVLLAVDYDRTMTGPDSVVPQRNREAIDYFVENGGSFTVNTGRGTNTLRRHLNELQNNVPLLLYNGSMWYENGRLTNCKEIDLPLWETVNAVAKAFPEMNVEIQGMDDHYLLDPPEKFVQLYNRMGWHYTIAQTGMDTGPFLKFAIYGEAHDGTLADMFSGTPEEIARFAQLQQFIESRWGEQVDTFLAAPRILDVHAKGVSKGRAALELKARLGKKILVCVGDAPNDIAMLDSADFAFCPADGVIADRYETVCNCGDGAVADVIYREIPKILDIQA